MMLTRRSKFKQVFQALIPRLVSTTDTLALTLNAPVQL